MTNRNKILQWFKTSNIFSSTVMQNLAPLKKNLKNETINESQTQPLVSCLQLLILQLHSTLEAISPFAVILILSVQEY
jgi:hypothetical protein